jgi:hypothetical protein
MRGETPTGCRAKPARRTPPSVRKPVRPAARGRRAARGCAVAALCVGLSGRAAEAQAPAPDAGPETSFAPPAPPLAGASPSGRDLSAPLAPSDLSPAGGLGAFGVPGGPAGQPGPPTGPTREYNVTARLDVSEAYESNIFGGLGVGGSGASGGGHTDDFITYVTPSITASADTPRLQANVFYAPTIQRYAYNTDQNFVGQNANGSATLTVFGDLLYVNASAFAAVQPRFGGTSTGTFGGFGAGAANLSREQQSQVYSYTVEPYAVRRFGDLGTAKVAYSYTQSYSNDAGTYSGSPTFSSQSLANGGGAFVAPVERGLLADTANSNLTTSREVGQFTSGEVLGRLRSVTLLSASQYGGGGVDTGAYENYFTEQLGYAVTRRITVFGEAGYEDILYDTLPVTRVQDAIWSLGVQLTPNPDSTIIVGYGHKFGFDSVFANGSYALTARTRLTGVYSTGLGTALQGIQNTIGNSSLDPFGNPIDYSTGAPTFLSSGQVGTTGNNSLYRIRQFTLTGATVLERDTYSVSFTGTDQSLVGVAAGAAVFQGASLATSQSSYSVIASWRHDLSPDLTSAVSLTYGRTRQSGETSSDDTYGADVVLNQALSQTLSAYVRYSFFDRVSNVPGFAYTDNIIRIGLSKTF